MAPNTAGKNILSVEAAQGGPYGVFLASNRGDNPRGHGHVVVLEVDRKPP